MLNPFPTLLAYGLVAPLIIRLALGIIFILSGYVKAFRRKETFVFVFSELGLPAPETIALVLGILEIIAGVCLIAGFGTQIVAIIFSLIALGALAVKIRRPDLLKQGLGFYILTLAMSVSLLFSGAGFFAFDLPL